MKPQLITAHSTANLYSSQVLENVHFPLPFHKKNIQFPAKYRHSSLHSSHSLCGRDFRHSLLLSSAVFNRSGVEVNFEATIVSFEVCTFLSVCAEFSRSVFLKQYLGFNAHRNLLTRRKIDDNFRAVWSKKE